MGKPTLRHRPGLLPFALLLSIVTSLVLAGIWVALVPTTGADGAAVAANDAVVRRFYAAVNETIHTGDVAALDAVVGDDYAGRATTSGTEQDRAGLARSLLALRVFAPYLALSPQTLVGQADRVVATVDVAGAAVGSLGLAIPAEDLWGRVETFRVRAGRIRERWVDDADLDALGLPTETVLAVRPPRAEDSDRRAADLGGGRDGAGGGRRRSGPGRCGGQRGRGVDRGKRDGTRDGLGIQPGDDGWPATSHHRQ